jgi:hypothetical protein
MRDSRSRETERRPAQDLAMLVDPVRRGALLAVVVVVLLVGGGLALAMLSL